MRTLIKSAFLKLFVFDKAVSNLARLIFYNMLKNKLQSHNFHKLRQCHVIKCKHPKQCKQPKQAVRLVSDAYISLPYCQLKQKSLSDAFGATERLFYVTLQDARFIKRSLPCQLQP